jgi:molecular chaperone DnaJ
MKENTKAGSGAKPGTSVKTCTTCGGHGQVQVQQGFFVVQRACHACSGTGQTNETPCGTCRGQGMVRKQKTHSVEIPAGVDTGNRKTLCRLCDEPTLFTESSNKNRKYLNWCQSCFKDNVDSINNYMPLDF